MQILLPTKTNKKLAIIKLEIPKNFLFAFNKLMPSSVSQRPRQININGKK